MVKNNNKRTKGFQPKEWTQIHNNNNKKKEGRYGNDLLSNEICQPKKIEIVAHLEC